MRRHGGDGEFRDMRIVRLQSTDPAQAEARAEAVDQMREFGGLVAAGEAGLLRIEPLGDQRRKPQHIEAEAGIAFVAQHCEAVGEQPAHARGIAQGRGGAELEAIYLAVGAEQRDLQKPRAFPAPLQHTVKLPRQMLDAAEHILLAADGIRKAPLRHGGGQRQARPDRFLLVAERLIDAAYEILPITGGERRTRAVDDVGDAVQANLRQRGDDLGLDAQGGERQRRDRFARSAFGDNRCAAIPRHRPGATDAVRHRRTRLQGHGGQPLDQVAAERRFAAEQMRTTGDVEEEPVGRVEANQRRIAVAPVGDRCKQSGVGIGIGIGRRQRRIHGARIGQRQARQETQARGGIVHRGDPQRGFHRSDDDERRLIRRG